MIFRIIILSLLVSLSISSIAQENNKTRNLDSLIQKTVSKYQLPSLSLVVCKGDNIIYSKAYGLKQINAKDSVNIHSKYYWASVSKTFTATAIMILNEQGKFELDDQVINYYPEFKSLIKEGDFQPDSITIRHLLTHTSGLPMFSRPWLLTNKKNHLPIDESLKIGDKATLASTPGEKYKYSNMGMQVLGVLIERVSGLSYPEFIKQSIINPLKLNETTFTEVDNLTDTSLATLHTWNKKQEHLDVQRKHVYTNGSSSAGGLKMSPHDMSKWLIECLRIHKGQDSFIKKSTLIEMWSQHKEFQALGWDFDKVGEFWGLGPYVAKGGNLEWMSDSYIIIFPDKQIAVAICVNANSDGFDGKEGFAAQILKEAIKL